MSGHEGIQLKANSADGQPLALVVVGRDTPLDAQQEENWKELSEFMKGFRRRTNVVGIHDCGCFGRCRVRCALRTRFCSSPSTTTVSCREKASDHG